MDPLATAQIGKTNTRVTPLGFGGAPLAGLGRDVPEEEAVATIRRALELGITYLDTAPLYGHSKGELRYGKGLAGRPRASYVLSTKVGRLIKSARAPDTSSNFKGLPPLKPIYNYSRDGILRSLEESLKRLNLDRVDILYIHDPDNHYKEAITEAYPTLAELRSQGVVKAIGAGMNQWQMLARFAREGDFDCFLLAGRYTLLDQSGLADLVPLCQEKEISIVIGGPYNSGILASDLQEGATFNYAPASPEVLQRARRLKTMCDRHQVPLKAAALQFVLAHPAVATVIPGARSVRELQENFRMVRHPIPNDLWAELKHEGLVLEEAPTPAG